MWNKISISSIQLSPIQSLLFVFNSRSQCCTFTVSRFKLQLEGLRHTLTQRIRENPACNLLSWEADANETTFRFAIAYIGLLPKLICWDWVSHTFSMSKYRSTSHEIKLGILGQTAHFLQIPSGVSCIVPMTSCKEAGKHFLEAVHMQEPVTFAFEL